MTKLNELIDGFRYRAWSPSHLPYLEADYTGEVKRTEKVVMDRLQTYADNLPLYDHEGTWIEPSPLLAKSPRHRHPNEGALIEAYPEVHKLLTEERQAEEKANDVATALINQVIEARSADFVTSEDMNPCFTWGVHAARITAERALYRDRNIIDAAGGLAGWSRLNAHDALKERLTDMVAETQGREQWLKTMFRVCLNAATAMAFPHLDWLFEEAARGRVAVISEAKLQVATDCWFYLAGSKYEHPTLGKDDGARDLSNRNGPGMTTTPLVALWPEHNLVRTVSRFYLLPNGIHIPDHLKRIKDLMDPAPFLARCQADDALGDKGKSYEYRDDMAEGLREAFEKATELAAQDVNPDIIRH